VWQWLQWSCEMWRLWWAAGDSAEDVVV